MSGGKAGGRSETNVFVTGGTGFLGRGVLAQLLERAPDAHVHVLVRAASASRVPSDPRITAVIGDLTAPGLGLSPGDLPDRLDHVIHLGAVYDLRAGEEQAATNVDGTRAVIDVALATGATLHHVSTIAVAGDTTGTFRESDFERGQQFPTPYHRTKFEAEKLVRESAGLTWRIYRPSAVVGDSVTGEIDKIDGPYYLFGMIAALAKLPKGFPMAVPALGSTNIVPVDYVTAAIAALALEPGLDGRTFHLGSARPQQIRDVYSALARAAGAPDARANLPGKPADAFLRSRNPRVAAVRKVALRQFGIPSVMADKLTFPFDFDTSETRDALRGKAIDVPDFGSYAPALWAYWTENLDPLRARRQNPAGPLMGRHILVTGGSSGIGRATAIAAARKGAVLFLLARSGDELEKTVQDIRAFGGTAYGYVCDITDSESVDSTVKAILAEHDHVDMLVNNAGRSIRRSLLRSTDRLHDFERTMAVNYFGAVRLILALLPHMTERKYGHVVNISSAAVQGHTPRFAAYVGSKSALDGFTEVAAAETLGDGITFTTIHMPLVDTPMIAPTEDGNAGPIATPEKAAAMVIRALVERPKRIDVPLGTLGEWGAMVNPRAKDRVMHQFFRAFDDSAAAKGEASTDSKSAKPVHAKEIKVPKLARRLGRLVPGTHW
ncbi:short chain dehydrogenase [Rhodococcoides trifolii]|uniref:Short chain dehydrogenase n=1 Tax=Rhodococcoides trifolii TaxID=908250 RepID=A0A917FW65_9NOCA|nr:SDR family oxidoreductase [Rhodococcus trifolii]GGG13731.1 short chain dehydrogenase [Rhodococcus trifolii]